MVCRYCGTTMPDDSVFCPRDGSAQPTLRHGMTRLELENLRVELRRRAEQGRSYYEGRGVAKDYEEAVHWFLQAAEQGHAEAQSKLGVMYQHGYGVEQGHAEAARWYSAAAEPDDDFAQRRLH